MLITTQNSKTSKGQKRGYLTGILYLKPADSGNRGNVCPKSTPGCKASCLNTAGRGQFSTVQQGRQRKTDAYYDDRKSFVEQLVKESKALAAKAEKLGLIPCIRINGTSDLPNLARQVAKQVPEIQLYDYTAIARPWKRALPNYHITFSRKENNWIDCVAALEQGYNVAVVFETKPVGRWKGYEVVDGDESDLRFLDGPASDGRGVIVALSVKGRAKLDTTGFVVRNK